MFQVVVFALTVGWAIVSLLDLKTEFESAEARGQ